MKKKQLSLTKACEIEPLPEWHYDHSVGRVVKGLNFITAFYSSPLEGVTPGIPIGCEVIQKVAVWNEKKACTEMKSPTTKNEHYRDLLRCCVQNAVVFGYVLNDSWFSGAENMNFVVLDLKKHSVMALNENRSVTCCDNENIVTWTGVLCDLPLSDTEVKAVYLSGVDFPVYVSRHVFKNEDVSIGVLYLASDDPTLSHHQILELYQRRWSVEEYHKSIKQHASFAKSPTSHPGAQVKHVLCSLHAYVTLEVYVSSRDGQARKIATRYGGGFAGWLDEETVLLSGKRAPTDELRTLESLNFRTGGVKTLATAQNFRSLSVASGGKCMVYTVAFDTKERNGLFLASTSDGTPRALPNFGSVRWRSADKFIMIPLESGASQRLLEIDAASGKARELLKLSRKVTLDDWSVSPDGEKMVFRSAGDLNLYALELP